MVKSFRFLSVVKSSNTDTSRLNSNLLRNPMTSPSSEIAKSVTAVGNQHIPGNSNVSNGGGLRSPGYSSKALRKNAKSRIDSGLRSPRTAERMEKRNDGDCENSG